MTITIEPLPGDLGARLLAAGADETCSPVSVIVDAEGGAPLRCCLRDSCPGERIVLASITPPGPADAYRERGPVFLHADACAGPTTGIPGFWGGRTQVLRSYDADGHISGGALAAPGEHIATAAALLEDPAVAFLQARNVVHGCYMATIRRG